MRAKGFKFCYAECSSHYSEKAIVKMGGVIEHVYDYATYEYNGAKPFVTI